MFVVNQLFDLQLFDLVWFSYIHDGEEMEENPYFPQKNN